MGMSKEEGIAKGPGVWSGKNPGKDPVFFWFPVGRAKKTY
jgi:hypothetical protein